MEGAKSREKWNQQRFGVFVTLHFLMCIPVLIWVIAYVKYRSSLYDMDLLGPLFALLGIVDNSVTLGAIAQRGFRCMAMIAGLVIALFQGFGLRDTDWVDESEVWGSLKVILISAGLSLVVGLFMGLDVFCLLVVLFAPLVFFEILPYWFVLYRTCRRTKKEREAYWEQKFRESSWYEK